MASFSKRLARPRLQLLLLTLVLGAGLLQRNSMVQAVKCWLDYCHGSADCLKKPADRGAETDECPLGCFHTVNNFTNANANAAERGCGVPGLQTCFDLVPGDCTVLEFTAGGSLHTKSVFNQIEFTSCIDRLKKSRGRSVAEGKEGAGESETCLCHTDLCNGGGTLPIQPRDRDRTVKCWKQRCERSFDCLKKPTDTSSEVSIVDCPNGYCIETIFNFNDEKEIDVSRRCASATEVTCLKDKPGKCETLQLTGDKAKDVEILRNSEALQCQLHLLSGNGRAAENERSESGPGTKEECLCNRDHCNGGTPPYRSTGVKHLGCNLALVGALLVAAFPLRTLFLVG